MELAFITKNNGWFNQVYEIKANPSQEDMAKLNEICFARGHKDYQVIYLTDNGLNKLKMFISE